MTNMETRKESLSALKVCRFCLTQNEPLSSLYEKSKAPKNSVTLSTKIMTCVAIEVFPSDKMPQYICNRCKLFMDLSYGFKQICRQADQNILHFVQNGTSIEPLVWPSLLNKIFKAHIKSEFGGVKTVTQDGATFKLTAEEVSDGEEGDDDNVYSVKIGDGSEELKHIKVITSVNNKETGKEVKKGFANMTKLAKHLRTHAGERPYPCKHCDKSFLKSHHYTRHLRVKHCETIRAPSGNYTEADAYRCEECEDAFSTQDELIYHSALHATRSLTCPLCQEKFDDVDTVTAHIKSHVNGAEFMCDYCELIFTTQEKLDAHIEASHDSEANDKDTTENEEDDTEEYEDESINVNEEKNHVLVEIKKAGDYILTDTVSMEEDEDNDVDELVASELELSLNDASAPLLAGKPTKPIEPPAPKPAAAGKADVPLANTGVSITRLDLTKAEANLPSTVTNLSAQTADDVEESPMIIKKIEEVKKKATHLPPSPAPISSDKKEKTNAKVESSSGVGASELSLRLLEKELADLQRTNLLVRNDVAKTPAKTMDSLKSKRLQIHTSTPKPRPIEKKEMPAAKPVPEKPLQEKRPPGRPPKDNKNTSIKEDKEAKEKTNVTVKEETKEVKEKDTPKVIKNGASDGSTTDEPVRRSTRPSKVKDYAKMIRDSPDEDDETSEEEPDEEEIKEAEKSAEPARRGRKPLPKPCPAVAPATAPRKRGRPRKDLSLVVPQKISKKEESEAEEESVPEVITHDTKPMEEVSKVANVSKIESKNGSTGPVSNVIVSPSGQTLKKVPIKALPPGVKPLPLPRKMTSGEVCEMQIGKKVVKVQKIVMTKAEVEAMTKKGLVEMKDGTIVLKQGIKLPGGGAASLISQMAAEEQKKESASIAKPTRCDFGDD